jgi:heme/copper-type cytochrome/quinol oxidase subunit 2
VNTVVLIVIVVLVVAGWLAMHARLRREAKARHDTAADEDV